MRKPVPRGVRTAAAALVLAIWGCTAPVEDGAATNTVRTLLTKAPRSLSIIGEHDSSSRQVAQLLSDSLVQYDTGMVLRPAVAESWEFSPDHLTLVFRLRDGVRWHDGRPVTAADVAFTVDRILDPATKAHSFAPGLSGVETVEAVDPRTVRVRFREAYADGLAAWWFPLIPEHLAGRDADLLTGEFARHPVGCGPFRFVSYEADRRLELEANPDHWAGPPRLGRIVFLVLPDMRSAYQGLLRGELDLMPATTDLYREALDTDPPGIEPLVYYRLNVWFLGWNQDGSNPFFGDPRVRRAMVLAMDRAGFAEKLLLGLARPAATTYHPESPWADPSVAPLPYDPPAARRLLEEAGWTDRDGDGVREKDGRSFGFTLLITASGQEIVDRMAAWIRQSLAEVGVAAEIERVEFQTFQERRNARRFQAMMSGLSFDAIPDQYEVYHSGATYEHGGFNYVAFADPEVDRLLEAGRVTFDPAERLATYHRLQARLLELQPISPVFHFPSPLLHDARLKGIETSPLDIWRPRPGPAAWYWAAEDGG